jgi:hypothetical protein
MMPPETVMPTPEQLGEMAAGTTQIIATSYEGNQVLMSSWIVPEAYVDVISTLREILGGPPLMSGVVPLAQSDIETMARMMNDPGTHIEGIDGN